jgi:hypothetical protein
MRDQHGAGSRPGIILAVRDEKRERAYLDALGTSVECTVLDNLKDLPGALRKHPCKGILIDVSLNVKATYMEKVRISDSVDAMPSATLNFDAKRGSIRLFMLNQKYGTAFSLDEFVGLCATYQPRVLYPRDQNALHLNARLSSSPAFGEDTEYTFTMYVTGSGCFLHTVNRTGFQPNEMVWIDFVGLSNRSPVQGKVCWKCEWGVSHAAPGIYVSFESILESQHEEIRSLSAAEQSQSAGLSPLLSM